MIASRARAKWLLWAIPAMCLSLIILLNVQVLMGQGGQERNSPCLCQGTNVESPERLERRGRIDRTEQTPEEPWQPPPMRPSLYKRVYGKEPFEETGRKTLALHTLPTDAWLNTARELVNACDLPFDVVPSVTPVPDAVAGDPHEITLVTVLVDLKRNESGMGMFKRDFSYYITMLQRLLDRKFPTVLFAPRSVVSQLNAPADRVHTIDFDVDKLQTFFPYYDRVQQIRTSDLFAAQARAIGYLEESPQFRQAHYNPLVMSKLLLTREAARVNPWNTERFLFVDAAHMCSGEITPGEMPVFMQHMDRFFATHWPYGSGTEVHGMADKAMHMYMGTAKDPFLIVRGGVFGGTQAYIECVTQAYMLALHATLSDGYMGTEENIFTIVAKHFPHLFHGFDNDVFGNHGDNCAIFQANTKAVKRAKKRGTWNVSR